MTMQSNDRCFEISESGRSALSKKAIDEDNLALIIESNARTIAEDIYKQILTHKKLKSESYLESDVREPKPYLEEQSISLSL